MTNSEINGFLRRVKAARKFFDKKLENSSLSDEEREDIELDESLISKLINDMCNYTISVFDDNYKNANRDAFRKSFNEVSDYQRAFEDIERSRKNTHNVLITDIKMVDNMCKRNGLEEICGLLPEQYRKDTSGLMGDKNRSDPGVVETRHKIAKWTWDIVIGCSIGMSMDKDFDVTKERLTGDLTGIRVAKKNLKDLTDPNL